MFELHSFVSEMSAFFADQIVIKLYWRLDFEIQVLVIEW